VPEAGPGPAAPPPPRVYAIVAPAAPIAAVFRRGPAAWWMVGRWELVSGSFEQGAWLKGPLYPRRCDLSPDGTLLAYFAAKGPRDRPFDPYVAVSKLPWLHALALWRMGTTYWYGHHFTAPGGGDALRDPDVGDARPLWRRHGLAASSTASYAGERRRGWSEDPRSEPYSGKGWDERRRVVLVKPRPRGDERLVLLDDDPPALRAAAAAGEVEGRHATYAIEGGRGARPLPGVAWAEWGHDGRLLVATVGGALQIRTTASRFEEPVVEHDLAALRPDPRRAPEWAQRW
jgi:hypothetical protein